MPRQMSKAAADEAWVNNHVEASPGFDASTSSSPTISEWLVETDLTSGCQPENACQDRCLRLLPMKHGLTTMWRPP